MNENLVAQLDDLLSRAKGDILNISWQVYGIIRQEKEDDAGALLEYFFTKYDRLDTSEEREVPVKFSSEEKEELKKKHGKFVDALLERQQAEGLPEKVFYQQVWEQIIQSSYLKTDEARAFALYYIWIDKRIPYYNVGQGKGMSNDEYRERSAKVNAIFQKIKYVLNSNIFSQKTQQASLVLDMINGAEDQEDRIVLMSMVLIDLRNSDSTLESLLSRLRSR